MIRTRKRSGGYRSTVQLFWSREDLSSLTDAEKIAYVKLLSTSDLYGLHGITSLTKTHGGTWRRMNEHCVIQDPIKSLAKKGFLVFDEFHELVFFPGSAADAEAVVNTTATLKKTIKILAKLPITSKPVQLWALSWFLSNIGKAKMEVLMDFLEYAVIWMKPLFREADLTATKRLNTKKYPAGLIELSSFVLPEPCADKIYIQNIIAPVYDARIVNNNNGFEDYFIMQFLGSDFEKRLELFKKRKATFTDSITRKMAMIFDQLYLAKKGVAYSRDNDLAKDMQRLGWLISMFGKDKVMQNMRMYFEGTDWKFTMRDFRANFKNISNPEAEDRSEYWKIVEEHEKRATGNN